MKFEMFSILFEISFCKLSAYQISYIISLMVSEERNLMKPMKIIIKNTKYRLQNMNDIHSKSHLGVK